MRLKYDLTQMTPMIHFQSEEPGAVIRESELKPKLDRFIKKKWKQENPETAIPDEWFLCSKTKDGRQNEALNYKVQLQASGEPIVSDQINRMYFGNMGDSGTKMKTIFYKEPIKLNIICFVKSLRENIDAYINEFFLTTNFGMRQSKGFGGFVIEDKAVDQLKVIENNTDCFYFPCKASSDDAMEYASIVYDVMKSGINVGGYNPGYIKGFIQRKYLDLQKKTNTGSDKAFIKQNMKVAYADNEHKESEFHKRYDDYLFVRALLGIPEQWLYDKGRKVVTLVSNDKEPVERFGSPVTIKILSDYVVFIFNDVTPILGKKFYMKKQKSTMESPVISVPDTFDAKQFIRDFVDYYNAAKQKEQLNQMKRSYRRPFSEAAKLKLSVGGEG